VRILGIDPGSNITGYGLLVDDEHGLKMIACGVIRTGGGDLAARLGRIAESLESLIRELKPDVVAVEDVFHARSVKSALVLGQARGAALAVAGKAGIPVCAYPARRIKQTVTGYGGADKEQVRRVLQTLLDSVPEQLDASDALAVAVCHARWS
jgi:crossover junction endodeoxyribonuclease RuvC